MKQMPIITENDLQNYYVRNHIYNHQNKLPKQTEIEDAISCLTRYLKAKLPKVKPKIYDSTNLKEFTKQWFEAQPNLTERTWSTTLENHRRMWRWITAETCHRKEKITKLDYAKEINTCIEELEALCWACDYADIDGCRHCLLKWGEHLDDTCICTLNHTGTKTEDGLYQKWKDSDTWQEAVKYAEQIAELPIK